MLADWRVRVIARASGGLPPREDADLTSSTFVDQDEWIRWAQTHALRGIGRRPPVCVDRYPMGFGRRPPGRVRAPAHALTPGDGRESETQWIRRALFEFSRAACAGGH